MSDPTNSERSTLTSKQLASSICQALDTYLILITIPIRQMFSANFTDEEIELPRNLEMYTWSRAQVKVLK